MRPINFLKFFKQAITPIPIDQVFSPKNLRQSFLLSIIYLLWQRQLLFPTEHASIFTLKNKKEHDNDKNELLTSSSSGELNKTIKFNYFKQSALILSADQYFKENPYKKFINSKSYREGLCHGISVLWYLNALQDKSFIQKYNKYFYSEPSQVKQAQFIYKALYAQNNPTLITKKITDKQFTIFKLENNVNQILYDLGCLQVYNPDVTKESTPQELSSGILSLATRKPNSLIHISLHDITQNTMTRHAVALFCHPTPSFSEPYTYFYFDPNLGEYAFPNLQKAMEALPSILLNSAEAIDFSNLSGKLKMTIRSEELKDCQKDYVIQC